MVGVASVTGDIVAKAFNTNDYTILHGGTIELNRANNDAFIDFKTTFAEDFDCRIGAETNGIIITVDGDMSKKFTFASTGNLNLINDLASTGGSDGIFGIYNSSNSGQTSIVVKKSDGTEFTIANFDGDPQSINFDATVLPKDSLTYDLGSGTKRWNTVFANEFNVSSVIDTIVLETGSLNVTGLSTFAR